MRAHAAIWYSICAIQSQSPLFLVWCRWEIASPFSDTKASAIALHLPLTRVSAAGIPLFSECKASSLSSLSLALSLSCVSSSNCRVTRYIQIKGRIWLTSCHLSWSFSRIRSERWLFKVPGEHRERDESEGRTVPAYSWLDIRHLRRGAS